jgi:hypothetical protein
MKHEDIVNIMGTELRKVRDYPRFRFHSFVFPNEIDKVRRRLKLSGIIFRTKPVVRDNMVVGYNIYVQG